MQAIFPFKLFCVGKPNLEFAKETFARRVIKKTGGWHQDAIHAAMIGERDSAMRDLISNARSWNKKFKFPAFWGPNYDWTPDQCHGGVISIALQKMLLQNRGKKILLLPAWPSHWDVKFKLHAPFQTTVKASVKRGKLVESEVVPAFRMGNIKFYPDLEK